MFKNESNLASWRDGEERFGNEFRDFINNTIIPEASETKWDYVRLWQHKADIRELPGLFLYQSGADVMEAIRESVNHVLVFSNEWFNDEIKLIYSDVSDQGNREVIQKICYS